MTDAPQNSEPAVAEAVSADGDEVRRRGFWRWTRRWLFFFILYWLFSPMGFWRGSRTMLLVESSSFGFGALMPWRQAWRVFVGGGFVATGIWQLAAGHARGLPVIGSAILSLLLGGGFLYRAWSLSGFAAPRR